MTTLAPRPVANPRATPAHRLLDVAIFAIVLPLPISYGLDTNARLLWTLLVFGVLAASIVLGRAQLARGWGVWATALFCAVFAGLSASVNAVELGDHIQATLFLIALWGLAPPVLAYLVDHREDFTRTAGAAFVAAQTWSSIVALQQAATGSVVGGAAAAYGRSPGLAGHTNILGVLAGVAILLCFAAARQRYLRAPAVLALAVNAAALVASGSLTSMFGLVLGMVVVFLVLRVRLRVVLLYVAGAVALVAGSVVVSETLTSVRSPLYRILQTTGQTGEISTLEIRLNTVAYAWDQVQRDWFYGAGLDDVSGVTYDQITLTHNLPIRAWFQGGIALFVAIVVIYLYALVLVARAIKHRDGAVEAGVIVTLLAFAMTSASLQQPYFWLILIAAAASIETRTFRRERQTSLTAR